MSGALWRLAAVVACASAAGAACSAFSSDDATGEIASEDAGTVRADAATDAAAPPVLSIVCNAITCSADASTCCRSSDRTVPDKCVATAACGAEVWTASICDDRQDCEALGFVGRRCCVAERSGYFLGSSCQDACAPGEFELCDPLAPSSCPPDAACRQGGDGITPYPYLHVCMKR